MSKKRVPVDPPPDKSKPTPDRIILVHGTFAESLFDDGPNWWQENSLFSKFLSGKLKGIAQVAEPFHWTGENSHVLRQFAAAELLERLERENDIGPFHVIAHSHGGTVLFHALTLSVERNVPLDRLITWTTVGTPFVFYRARFRKVLKAHLPAVLAFAPLMVVAAAFGLQHLSIPLFFSALTLFLLSLLMLFAYFARSSTQRSNHLERETIHRYAQRWTGIRSRHDEAIALLRAALAARPKILPKWEMGPRWSYSHPKATKVRGRIPRRVLRQKWPSANEPAFWIPPSRWLRSRALNKKAGWKLEVRSWMVVNVFYWPFKMMAHGLSLIYNHRITALADGWAISVTASKLLGDDSPYFEAATVCDVPSPNGHFRAIDLPVDVEDAIFARANSEAAKAVSELRRGYISQLVMSPASVLLVKSVDLPSPAASLAHCLYFDVPACCELIGSVIHYHSGATETGTAANRRWVKQAQELSAGLIQSS